LLAGGAALRGQPGSIETLEQTGKTFARIAEQASDSVVGIRAEKEVQARRFGGIPQLPFDDFFFDRFFRRQMPQQQNPQEEFTQTAQGSGFIISADGYILTNNHLVGEADKVTVKLSDEREYEGEIIGTDPASDVALIKIDRDELPTLELADSDDVEVGEWVLAVGNPFGFSHSVTAGIISAKGRTGVGVAAYEDFIQTDAAINPGNSGGPLMNLKGEVVGINTAIISRTGGNLGIGLAIPSNMAEYIYNQLLEEGKVVRGYLGVTIQNMTDELAESFGLEDSRGVLIPNVTEGSAAEKGGIRKGDIIVELNDEPIEKAEELRNKVAMLKPGTEVELVVLRDDRRKTLTVRLGRRPSEEQLRGQMREQPDFGEELGLSVQNLTDELAQRLGYEQMSGVVVSGVRPGSLAAEAGLRTGMLITEVDREDIRNVREFNQAISEAKEEGSALLLVNTPNFSRYIVIKFDEED
jgi:serine protease Do